MIAERELKGVPRKGPFGDTVLRHSLRVAKIVEGVIGDEVPFLERALRTAVPILHDVLEDSINGYSEEDLVRDFSPYGAEFVQRLRVAVSALTEPKQGKWWERKGQYISQVSQGPEEAKETALADKIDQFAELLRIYEEEDVEMWQYFGEHSSEYLQFYWQIFHTLEGIFEHPLLIPYRSTLEQLERLGMFDLSGN